MKYITTVFYGFLLFLIIAIDVKAKPYDSILRFIQSHSEEDENDEERDNDQDNEGEENEEGEEREDHEEPVKEEEDESHENENDEKPSTMIEEDKNKLEVADKPLVEEPKKNPSWVDEEDLISEFEVFVKYSSISIVFTI
eukprot:XP_764133.1 hypothetical protein [Theileria parva strain Muguga]